jgi:hypothetical protein
MAKKRTRKASVKTVRPGGSSPAAIIVNTPSAPVRRAARRSGGSRTVVVARRVGSGVRRVSTAAGAALLSAERTGAMLGAGLLGLLDKQGTKLPTVPVLGRAGTSGLILWWLSKHQKSPQLNHAATGCLSIAVYELMRDGKIAGDDMPTVFSP